MYCRNEEHWINVLIYGDCSCRVKQESITIGEFVRQQEVKNILKEYPEFYSKGVITQEEASVPF